MLSASRLRGFVLGMLAIYLVVRLWVGFHNHPGSWGAHLRREAAAAGLTLLGFALFLLVGAVWHRPMLRLAGVPAGTLVVDFHSHTNVSHDVRGTLQSGFDAEANRRWHHRAGFDAVFITDHNTTAGWTGHLDAPERTPVLCPGIEVSAWRAHIVLLGDTLPVDPSHYDGSLDSLLALLAESGPRYGAIAIASLPEYERSHWNHLSALVGAGLGGFEVVNASPKANELTRARRDTVIELARTANRLILGVSDQHGWGATSMVWNLVALPPQEGEPRAMCGRLLQQLRVAGYQAVQVVERHRLRPDDWWPLWLTPVGTLLELWRSMSWPLTASWLAWTWGLGWLRAWGKAA
jgi:hypothetical protein